MCIIPQRENGKCRQHNPTIYISLGNKWRSEGNLGAGVDAHGIASDMTAQDRHSQKRVDRDLQLPKADFPTVATRLKDMTVRKCL